MAPTDSATCDPDGRTGLPQIAGIILAAGGSSRMGLPKQLLQFGGVSLLRRACQVALQSGLSPAFVVLGPDADRFARELDGLSVATVINANWREGIGSSIRTGIRAVRIGAPNAEAIVIMLCDQPMVRPELIAQLADRYRATGSPIVASRYQDTLGVPALFARSYFAELESLRGGSGAKGVIASAGAAVQAVPFPAGVFDIDTEHDLRFAESLLGSTMER